MNQETYLRDPCGASSLPFWKTNSIPIPDDLLILREDDPRLKTACHGFIDTPYFKLIHRMEGIEAPTLPKGFRFITPGPKQLPEHISACYESEGTSEAELLTYRTRPTYSSDLWLAVMDDSNNEIIASGIAELDPTIREGILEWIQVSPDHRRQGWGSIVVNELLFRLQGRADFVTASGKVNSPWDPRALYERCGFREGVIWHILHKA